MGDNVTSLLKRLFYVLRRSPNSNDHVDLVSYVLYVSYEL